ncbi:MAG: hypothetical protein RQ753_01170 [Desulfurivibrionaceae bacterium]|nr:hypothetical protein [Desulfurivibrionaceae bacterium]
MLSNEQYVCLTCGYNMIGYYPDFCPFCGAPKKRFITADECSSRFDVVATRVTDEVAGLNSVPPLGLEHSAYRINTGGKIIWIDCPATFAAKAVAPAQILFTHHHFLGAANLYRDHAGCRTGINRADSGFELCRGFTFDELLENPRKIDGIESFHIDGHTPGFTVYLFKNILFLCDYVSLYNDGLKFNPFGPVEETGTGGLRLYEIIKEHEIGLICGFNYVSALENWLPPFRKLLAGCKRTGR